MEHVLEISSDVLLEPSLLLSTPKIEKRNILPSIEYNRLCASNFATLRSVLMAARTVADKCENIKYSLSVRQAVLHLSTILVN